MMNKSASIILMLLVTVVSLPAQDDFDCDLFRSSELTIDQENLYSKDLLNGLISCGVDSADFSIIPRAAFGSILIRLISEKKDGEAISNGDLIDKLNEFITSQGFLTMKNFLNQMNAISDKPASLLTWDRDLAFMLDAGTHQDELDRMRAFLSTKGENELTYQEFFVEYNQHREAERKVREEEIIRGLNGCSFMSLMNHEVQSVDSAIARSIVSGLPVLLYFTGWAVVNARKMEEAVLTDPEVLKIMCEQFEFVSLYLDDRTALPAEEQYVVEETGSEVKTIGQKAKQMQIELTGTNYQPYFVMMNSKSKIIGEFSYSQDKEAFIEFLKQRQ